MKSGCMSRSRVYWAIGMCQGRLCHSFRIYFLLIAIAIQGVTPDAHDLASINSLLLFCPALADSRGLDGEDGLPDEVCGPAQPDMGVRLRDRAAPNGLANGLSGTTDHHDPLTIRLRALRSHARGDKHPRLADLIYALCRLRC
jgi:hypothetical protein